MRSVSRGFVKATRRVSPSIPKGMASSSLARSAGSLALTSGSISTSCRFTSGIPKASSITWAILCSDSRPMSTITSAREPPISRCLSRARCKSSSFKCPSSIRAAPSLLSPIVSTLIRPPAAAQRRPVALMYQVYPPLAEPSYPIGCGEAVTPLFEGKWRSSRLFSSLRTQRVWGNPFLGSIGSTSTAYPPARLAPRTSVNS